MKPARLAHLLVCVAGVVLGQTTAPRIPAPSGPFGIGRVGYHWTDESRAHRELMVYVWYPTARNIPDARGTYIPGARQIDAMPEAQTRMRRAFGANWPSMMSGEISSHAVEGVPLTKTPKRLPVVVFSHGAGSTGFNYTALIEDLTSHGYIVAAIEHTYAAKAVWFPDGRVVPMRDDLIAIDEGAADVRFVLDRLTELNLFGGRLDLNRIAAMGHSAGAEYSARACQFDLRLKACVDLDGAMVPEAALPVDPNGAALKQPLLFLEADHPESQMGGTHAQHEEYFRKKEEQLQSCLPGSYDVAIRSAGIGHPSFSDMPLLFAGQNEYPETKAALHNLDLIEKFVLAFLGKTLNRENAPLLDGGDALHPEATVKPYGH